MADPDFQIRRVGGGGLKDIFRSFRPQFGLKIRGEGRRRDPRAPDLDPPLQPFFFSSCFCEEKRMQRFVLPNIDTISLKNSTNLKSKITKKKMTFVKSKLSSFVYLLNLFVMSLITSVVMLLKRPINNYSSSPNGF